MENLFASDYGVLKRGLFSVRSVTNASELLRSEEIYRILHLCGIPAAEGSEVASDWELFFSFCKAYPLLRGHLVAERTGELLCERLSLSLPLTEENAATLWRESAAHLAAHPLSMSDLTVGAAPWLCDGETLPAEFPERMPHVLDSAVLMPRDAETRAAWNERIRTVLSSLSEQGCVGVRFLTGAAYEFTEPNPYAVDRALATRRRGRDAENLLLSQLLREICGACTETGLPLTVECEGDAAAAELLRYVRRTVGLPPITVSARMPATRDALLSLAEEADIRMAIRLSDAPTARELSDTLEAMAARYPIGRVRLITGADLRQSALAQRNAVRLWRRAAGGEGNLLEKNS